MFNVHIHMFSHRYPAVIITTVVLLVLSLGVLLTGFPQALFVKASTHPMSASSEDVRVLIAFAGPVEKTDIALVRAFGGEVRYNYNLVDAVAATVPEAALAGLEHHPLVTHVELDTQVKALDVELENTWSVSQITADIVQDTTTAPTSTGANVKIGIIDSGVNYYHPDLDDNFDPNDRGYDFYNYSDTPIDVYGHGTHVAGSACAEDNANGEILNNGDRLGVVGVAPDCQLYSLRVHSDDGMAYWSDIIAAVDYATGEPVYLPEYWDSDVGAPTSSIQGPKLDIINLSLGKSSDPGTIVQDSFDAAYYEHDILIIAAAGNSGNRGGNNDSIIYPAKFDSVMAVGATDRQNTRATWSSTGPALEIVAPGDGVYSTWNDEVGYADPQPVCTEREIALVDGRDQKESSLDGEREGECYKYGAGTSMASPHIAGVAALMIAADKAVNNGVRTLTAAKLRARITETAQPLGNTNEYGSGLVDAVAAVQAVLAVDDGSDDEPATNQAPQADFTYSTNELTATFDASASSDSDGTVEQYSWTFGDGTTSTDQNPIHAYATGGTYEVTLLVTDNDGATDTMSASVTVQESAVADIQLSATGYKVKGLHNVDLEWSGATTDTVDVWRDGNKIVTTDNNGTYTDAINQRGGANYIYQICEAASSVCSAELRVSF